MTCDIVGRKLARDAKVALDQIVRHHPGTPWEVLARDARDAPIGLNLEPVK